MHQIVVDAGPFIHLIQINEITLLRKFPAIYTSSNIISEISSVDEVPAQKISAWDNIRIIHIQERNIPELEGVNKQFRLHPGERDVLYLAHKLTPAIILTDDLEARSAAESLGIEVHGTVGIISYAFHRRWISIKTAEESLLLLYRKSSLFVTFAIIEKAIRELRKHH